ncbi:Mbov_0396 family ICE element transmembrane protein [Spiroplasma endosymbiont of Danaus chrysippus]|uniref:Mbov_0396 family ICE element transmembrane protein n=1 Tax=Spiroplasma endosymbiont of Danaus chrysippus TaxID=2691041 RepID=UPI0013C99BFF|nr:hypothetical protein [Spiroplasma endosymbiont of Danaus chrysippus]
MKGPLYIVHGLGDAITYLSGQKIVDKIFGTNGHFLNMPPQFLIFLAIAIMLIVLFAGGVILHAMVHQNIRSEIAGIANRSIIVILLLLLIPLFFWVINFTVISIIHIIMPEFVHGEKLANMVGALGFTDGLNHQDWHYDVGYPDMENYNLFLGTLGSFFCMIIFFYLGLSLIQRIFDLFLLYITSPIIFSTATSGVKWQKINLWKDLVIGRFISSLGIVLSLTLFINLEPLMLNAGNDVSDSWIRQSTFKLLFITGGAVATYNSQMLFASMVGQTVGIMEGMRMLTTMKSASSGLKAGTIGMFGLGKSLLIGKRKMLGKNKDGEGSGVLNRLQSGGLAKFARFSTKATVGSVLATAGFIGGSLATYKTFGVKGSLKRAGKHAIVNPTKKLANIVKSKSSQQYAKGTSKHESHNLKNELKNQFKKTPFKKEDIDLSIVGSATNKNVIHGTTARYTNKPRSEVDQKIVDKYFENGQPNWYDNQSKNNTEKIKSDWFDTKNLGKKPMRKTKNNLLIGMKKDKKGEK